VKNISTSAIRPEGRPKAAIRSLAWQALVFAILIATSAFLITNLLGNLHERSIRTGFGFLWQIAGFNIGESFLTLDGTATYGLALVVGLLNTLAVTAVAVVLSTILGTFVALGRLSRNPLVAPLATAYVEVVRNVPLLLQLFLWYAVLTQLLPPEAGAGSLLPGIFLTKGGLRFPVLAQGSGLILAALLIGLTLSAIYRMYGRRRHVVTGVPVRFLPSLALVVLPPLICFCVVVVQIGFELPVATRFGFKGGGSLTPELTALVVGLSIYNAAFVGEILRGGIEAVAKGQEEAAAALGLRHALVLRLIIVPQALRVIVPPLAGQYLNLAKNSSLAVAIGYPDLMSIGNTIINQTGQAVEVISIVMGVYLVISLAISGLMNWYNARILEVSL
jgi:general L-amino acid transport system permease protein